MQYFQKLSKRIHSLYFLLLILTLWSLGPYVKTSLSCADDAEIYLQTIESGIFSNVKNYAENTGRIFVYLAGPLSRLPYLINIHLAKAINLLFVLFAFVLLSYILFRLTRDKWMALLLFLFLLTFLNVAGDHNPVISYPWSFTLSFDCILLSMLLSLEYSLKQKKSLLTISFISFCTGLIFYEVFVLFFPLVYILSLQKGWLNQCRTAKEKIVYLLKSSIPFTILALVYFVLFFGYRIFHPAQYNGTSFIYDFHIKQILNTILSFARGATPFYFINDSDLFRETGGIVLDPKNNFLQFLQHVRTDWYIKALITSWLGIYIALKIKKTQHKSLLTLLAVSFLYVFIPSIPLAFTEKYTVNYWQNDYYIPTFYSYHFLMITLILIVSSVAFINNKIARNFLFSGVFVFLFAGTLFTEAINHSAMKNIMQTSYRFDCMDKFAKTEVFGALPENSQILCPDLYGNIGRQNNTFDKNRPFRWHNYFKTKYNKITKTYTGVESFAQNYNSANKNYYLKYLFDRKSSNQFIAFGEITGAWDADKQDERIFASKVDCFYFSPDNAFTLSFTVKPENDSLTYVLINDSKIKLSGNFCSFKCRFDSSDEVFKSIQILAPEIDMSTMEISDIDDNSEADIIL